MSEQKCGCYHQGKKCGAVAPGDFPFLCNLPDGHKDEHVACGGKDAHRLHTWSNSGFSPYLERMVAREEKRRFALLDSLCWCCREKVTDFFEHHMFDWLEDEE